MKKIVCLMFCIALLLIASTAVAGWEKSDNKWWYSYPDGSYPQNEWLFDKDWYYFDSAGWMVTGWNQIDGIWYYFAPSGSMQTGWKKLDNVWYYMNGSGEMQTGWLRDGNARYYLSSSGAMQTGWQNIDNTWYYFDGSGAMQTGWVQTNGVWYYLRGNGQMATGWIKDKGISYYMDNSGAMATGWRYLDNNWYFFENSGEMTKDWRKVGITWYYFDEKGKLVKEGPLYGNNTGVWLTDQKDVNNDFVAWIRIPGTNVNYPVVRSNNIEWYLDHNFTGEKSKDGTLFSLGKCDWKKPSKNIAVYGHHVEGSGNRMFKALLQYKDWGFYAQHPVIYMDSMYSNETYRIFAVFDMIEGTIDPSRTNFGSDEEFLDFVNYAKQASYYSTDVNVDKDDTIITLITCDRYFRPKVGRLIVAAVRE